MWCSSMSFVSRSITYRRCSCSTKQNDDFTDAEQAQCVFWFQNAKSATQAQKRFHVHYGKDFCLTYSHFAEAVCCVIQTKKSDRPVVNEETVSQVKMCISQSPSPTVDLCIFMHTCKSYYMIRSLFPFIGWGEPTAWPVWSHDLRLDVMDFFEGDL
jgi:hypothetical protein